MCRFHEFSAVPEGVLHSRVIKGSLVNVSQVFLGKADDVGVELGKINPRYRVVTENLAERAAVSAPD